MSEIEHRTFCRFCISVCGLRVRTDGDRVVSVAGDRDHPVTAGYTCPKGRTLAEFHHRPDRLDHPMLRRDGELVRVEWPELLDDLAGRLRRLVDESGPDAVGTFLATAASFDPAGRTAGMRLLQRLGSRSAYSSATVDTPGKPLVAELMGGYPGLIPALDHEDATLTLLVGTNPVVSHGHLNALPVPTAALRRLAERGEVWVLDPRHTETARLATRHLAPRPGTDHAVLAFLVRSLLAEGADTDFLDEHTEGAEELAAAVDRFDRETTAACTGLPGADLDDLVRAVRRHGRLGGLTGTGVSMSGTANVSEWLLWALLLVTGSFDRPGGMWFHPGFLSQLDRRRLRRYDGSAQPGPRSRPELPGRYGELPAAALAGEIEAGNLRALLVGGGNPVLALPQPAAVTRALSRLDVLAVIDVLPTATTALATHVLPAAGQLERADLPLFVDRYLSTMVTQYTAAVVPPAAERRPMWWVFAQLADRLGISVLPDGLAPDTAVDDDLLAELGGRGRVGFDELRAADGPVLGEPAVHGWVTGSLPAGRWQLAPEPLVHQLAATPSAPADPESLTLVARRQVRHLNSQLADDSGRTGREAPAATLHPSDAAARGISDGQAVRVRSAHGALRATAQCDGGQLRGTVSVPHGWADPAVGSLTSDAADIDPLTGMVLQTAVPVTVTPGPSDCSGSPPHRSTSSPGNHPKSP